MNIWGPALWNILHTVIINYSPKKKYITRHLLNNLIIPCPICKYHYDNSIKNIDKILHNNTSANFWLYNLHSSVNKHKGVKNPTYDSALFFWAKRKDQNLTPHVLTYILILSFTDINHDKLVKFFILLSSVLNLHSMKNIMLKGSGTLVPIKKSKNLTQWIINYIYL
jgi:hypothetical protein